MTELVDLLLNLMDLAAKDREHHVPGPVSETRVRLRNWFHSAAQRCNPTNEMRRCWRLEFSNPLPC